MHASPSRYLLALVAILAAAALRAQPDTGTGPLDGQSPPPNAASAGSDEIEIFGTLSVDRSENLVEYTRFRLTKGDLVLTADRASIIGSVGNTDGEWSLQGGVSISIRSLTLRAQSATFTFNGDELVTGTLLGDPVTYEDVDPQSNDPVTGTAGRVIYDHRERSVRLSRQPTFTMGDFEITQCDITYFVDEGDLNSNDDVDCEAGGRIRMPTGALRDRARDAETEADASAP